jgi:hypothetical protein
MTCVLLGCTLLLAGSPLLAQTRPDFSGRWVAEAEPARSGVTGTVGSGWGASVAITQDDRSVTVESAYFSRYDMQPPLRFVYALDGSESRNTVMVGNGTLEEVARVGWDGSAMLITALHSTPHPTTPRQTLRVEVTRRLALDLSGSLVIETTRAGVLGGQASTVRAVYRKQ